MSVTCSDGRSPWSKRIDRALDAAVKDQVLQPHQAEELKKRLAKTTAEVDRAVQVILGNRP